MTYYVKLSVWLNCGEDMGYRLRHLIENLLEKNVDGDLLKEAKTLIQYREKGFDI